MEAEVRLVMARLLDAVSLGVHGRPASRGAEASGSSAGADSAADTQPGPSGPEKGLSQADQAPQRLTGVVRDPPLRPCCGAHAGSGWLPFVYDPLRLLPVCIIDSAALRGGAASLQPALQGGACFLPNCSPST